MKRVQVLDPRVAERIAAGEVIERPSSVVKELVENSIDAGATEIAVILEDGGKALIEVIDNGHGMHRDDMVIALKRHATSKLSSLDDLEKIMSLGFRGEALPSIAAVADLAILSRTAGASSAFEVQVQNLVGSFAPHPVTFGHFLGSEHGTRIQARGIFSQIPARLKFLKSQAAEVSQVREWIERLALGHPHVGFKLVSNDRAVLSLRPQEEIERVRAILSDGEDFPVVTSSSNDLGFVDRGPGAFHIRVHWLQGLSTPQTRRLVQVVNGRAVRDRMLQQALLMPFKQALLPGQFPAVALFIDIDPAQIDVNVHPTKTELRFMEARKVFHAVETVVDAMIGKHGAPTYAQSLTGGDSAPMATDIPFQRAFEVIQPSWTVPSVTQRFVASESAGEIANESGRIETEVETVTPAPELTASPFAGARFAGILFNTYILFDLGQELVMIDQHAAHERIRYEKLKSRVLSGESPSSQALLLPEAVQFDKEERRNLEARLPWLAALGFEAEIFGENSLLFRAIPGEWGTHELRPRLSNLVERTLAAEASNAEHILPAKRAMLAEHILKDETLFEKLASEACHSAIRAGDRLEPIEAEHLVQQLFQCAHAWNCPHGRPTVVRVPRGRLEEWFQRRV